MFAGRALQERAVIVAGGRAGREHGGLDSAAMSWQSRLMASFTLRPHETTPPGVIDSMDVAVSREGSRLTLTYFIQGDTSRLHLPPFLSRERADGLWTTTCFELFVRQTDDAYLEFNFSPSGQWAAYRFEGYRDGMRPVAGAPVLDSGHRVETGAMGFVALVDIKTEEFAADGALRLGLSAVIEEEDGAKSYWALTHPSDKPDFHHPNSFALEIP